jgi:hypothetical protein
MRLPSFLLVENFKTGSMSTEVIRKKSLNLKPFKYWTTTGHTASDSLCTILNLKQMHSYMKELTSKQC